MGTLNFFDSRGKMLETQFPRSGSPITLWEPYYISPSKKRDYMVHFARKDSIHIYRMIYWVLIYCDISIVFIYQISSIYRDISFSKIYRKILKFFEILWNFWYINFQYIAIYREFDISKYIIWRYIATYRNISPDISRYRDVSSKKRHFCRYLLPKRTPFREWILFFRFWFDIFFRKLWLM